MSSKKSGTCTVKNNSVSNTDKPENKQGSGSASSVNRGNDVDTSDVLKTIEKLCMDAVSRTCQIPN